MPIYEYHCPECGTVEIMQKMAEEALSKCPECAKRGKSSHIERLISMSAFHLKGSGWYKTDYSSGVDSNDKNGSPKVEKSTPTATDKTVTEKPAATAKTDNSSSCSVV